LLFVICHLSFVIRHLSFVRAVETAATQTKPACAARVSYQVARSGAAHLIWWIRIVGAQRLAPNFTVKSIPPF